MRTPSWTEFFPDGDSRFPFRRRPADAHAELAEPDVLLLNRRAGGLFHLVALREE